MIVRTNWTGRRGIKNAEEDTRGEKETMKKLIIIIIII